MYVVVHICGYVGGDMCMYVCMYCVFVHGMYMVVCIGSMYVCGVCVGVYDMCVHVFRLHM